jgi:tetratricopeptide (TPR) repeat protein
MTLSLNARQQFELGAAAYIRKEYKKSAALFSNAIKFDRNFAPGYIYRGSAYLKNGQVDAAMADFERAIQLDPAFALAYHMRALAHEKKGNYAEAYRDFDSALHIDPYFGSAYCGRDSVLSRQNADQCHDEAEIIDHLNSVRLQPAK